MRAAMLVLLAVPAACGGAATTTPPTAPVSAPSPYAGSLACRPCHAQIYDRWAKTPMANVVRDPREHPDAIIPDLATPNPLVTFGVADIAFVYGSRWKQRYFTRRGGELFPLPAQWDVTHKTWKPYHVAAGTDWWVSSYGDSNLERPTGPLCDGCHSVDYDVVAKQPREWNVGCERCHGPGADHARAPSRANIINPSRLPARESTDICVSCHSQGRPTRPPRDGLAYDWPVGYRPGLPLADYWRLEDHEPGTTTFTHYPDGTAHKNRMQGNDFEQAVMYQHDITCSSCHDTHGTANPAQLVAPATEVCRQCHDPAGPRGPRAPTIEAHTHHRADSPGSECVACHMPAIEQTLGDVMVRSHTFRIVTPELTVSSKIPNPCTVSCHADKSPAWAIGAMQAWRAMP
jgi:predicted CXXCH cytochrome family protein|nr:cytochrome c3 family protein [Kofleriaceae bacterium]